MLTARPAILLFSRRPAAEATHRQWAGGAAPRSNEAIARAMLREARRNAGRSGWPVFHVHEGQQVGATFGARLAHAFADLFAKGFTAVVAVGNDAPGIRRVDWTAVGQALATGRSVTGRTTQGGAYLIGLTAGQFARPGFDRLPWETPELGGALSAWLDQALELPRLPELHTRTQLLRWTHRQGPANRLARRLQSLLHSRMAPGPFLPDLLPAVYTNPSLQQRGPPSL